MGFFDWLFKPPQPKIPQVPSILPDVAKNEILNGRLPHITVDKLFVNRGEICHYADKAILVVEKKRRVVHSHHMGRSMPGLLKGNRWNTGMSTSYVDEDIESEEHRGILYITNKRIIFSSDSVGFDKQYRYLSSVRPYSNAIELQYGSNIYSLFIPDGNIAYSVIQMLK